MPSAARRERCGLMKERLNLIQSCDRAVEMVSQARGLAKLYAKAVHSMGEGELRTGIMDLAVRVIQDEALNDEVFSSDEDMLSFLCGIWIQFLLIEIAGIDKGKLKAVARKVFQEIQDKTTLH